MIQNNELYLEIGKVLLLITMIIIGVSILYWYLKRRFPADDTSFPYYFIHFEPKNGLELQTPFWASIFVPVILFLCTGVFAWWGTPPDVSAEGFKTFLLISKLPIALLALAIPLAVLTGRIHGTKQTALQIEKTILQIENTKIQINETKQKNKTDLYLAHNKHFNEHIEVCTRNAPKNLFSSEYKLTINSWLLYKRLYPDSSLRDGFGKINKEHVKDLVQAMSALNNLANEFANLTKNDIQYELTELIPSLLNQICRHLCIHNPEQFILGKLSDSNSSKKSISTTSFVTSSQYFYDIVDYFKILPSMILSFELSEKEIIELHTTTAQEFSELWVLEPEFRESLNLLIKNSLKLDNLAKFKGNSLSFNTHF